MKYLLSVVAILAVASFALGDLSICDKYAQGTHQNGSSLVGTIINQVVGRVAVNQSAPTAQFFNGQNPSGNSVDFLTNSTALGILFNHLVQFFGSSGALDCTDGSIAAYAGNPDMQAVHAKFPINNASFEFFNNQVVAVAAGLGVVSADQISIYDLLEEFRGSICNQPDCQPGTTTTATGSTSTAASTTTTGKSDAFAYTPIVALVAASFAALF